MLTIRVIHEHNHKVSVSVLEALSKLAVETAQLRREMRNMALDITGIRDGIAALRNDVGNVARRLEELANQAPGVTQEELNALAAELRGIDTDLDALAPDAPAEESAPSE